MIVALLASAAMAADSRCINTWRPAYYTAQALDIGTTVASIESGRGREANPVYRLLFGKHVSSLEVGALKAAAIGFGEWTTARMMRRGDYAATCQNYKISAILIGGVAALNLRVVF